VFRRYESVAAETVHGWLVDLHPNAPALVLDVGAGTSRDAAWLASRGLEVVAVEPSGAMRAEAQRLHPSPSIRWISDSPPGLDQVLRLGLSFDLILLSAVWMHVPPRIACALSASSSPSSSQGAPSQLPCATGQRSPNAAFTLSLRLR
jgi:SAM-dependent methyltransferase